ncbi:MAG: DUF3427 domain-containing protein [Candidatus Brocadiia bacterium]
MILDFDRIERGETYSRPDLADIWGYESYHALARGVVTPADDHKIILFVTEEKQGFQTQYQDRLIGLHLMWEGPTDHYAEDRMLNADRTDDEIHVFHRDKHHTDFTYLGQAEVVDCERHRDKPSAFVLRVC